MKAAAHSSKDARIDLRVNLTQKTLLELAAASQGKKLSDFVISASTEAAQMALADQNRFVLPEEQMTKFLESLEEEPRDIPELRALFARKSVFECAPPIKARSCFPKGMMWTRSIAASGP